MDDNQNSGYLSLEGRRLITGGRMRKSHEVTSTVLDLDLDGGYMCVFTL